tara:strand:+ start:98 stop:709 length:612 start_codon:yes stop_codon:yes gene_type:complete
MSLPSSTKELDAINDILNSVGQASVTSIDQTNPDVSLAYRTLLSVSREVQSEGWSFNQEYDVQFSVDSVTKKIAVPPDVINIDATKEYYQYDTVVRNDFLYDRCEQTDIFDVDFIKCNVTRLYDFDNLPQYVKDYIVARAAAVTSTRIVGDPTQYQLLKEREVEARSRLLENDCNTGDYSFFGYENGKQNYYTPYQPFRALQR